MSKTKLAILVFCVAFGVNVLAFLFSKKTFSIEEVKNVWLYELPPTASPLDAYPAIDLGPQQGVIGTLFKPNFRTEGEGVETLLADSWTWNEKLQQLTIKLKDKLIFSDGTPIVADHFIQTAQWVAPQIRNFATPEWQALADARWSARDPQTLLIEWKKLPTGFEFQKFLKEVMTNSLAGVIHPQNLEGLKKNEKITKAWISSGSYKVRKWNPKEIVLISRDDFPVMMQKEFFRTLKYQSAPVKNPSCDFMQAAPGEEKGLQDHNVSATDQTLHVFWICRSWNEKGSFCSNPQNREAFAKLISGTESRSSQTLVGQKVRYRIPTGSDGFRAEIRSQIEDGVKMMGGSVEEISYFFRPSTEADIELLFVMTPKEKNSEKLAENLAQLSTRLGDGARLEKNLVGEIEADSVNILMKHMNGEVFDRAFLLPDLDEKKLPI